MGPQEGPSAGQRLAALAAMVALVAGAALLLAGVVVHLGGLVVAFIGFLTLRRERLVRGFPRLWPFRLAYLG